MTTHAVSQPTTAPLGDDELARIDAWWRAANYLSVGQIYLMDNPLLREPLLPEHVKPRLLGHWGTTPGLNFVYAHLNRAIAQRDLDMIYVIGPGPRRPGAGRLVVPRGHATPRPTPTSPATRTGCSGCSSSSPSPAASRATSHPRPRGRSTRAASWATRSPTRTARRSTTPTWSWPRVVGDGEAETGPLATSWHCNKFLDPAPRRRGAADPAPQRLQDRQPDRAGPDPRRRARRAAARLRPRAVRRRRRRPGDHAPGLRGDARPLPRRDPRHPGRVPAPVGSSGRPRLADDRAADARRAGPARRRSTARRSRATGAPTRCRSPTRAATTATARSSRTGCAATGPRSCSTPTGAPGRRDRATCTPRASAG